MGASGVRGGEAADDDFTFINLNVRYVCCFQINMFQVDGIAELIIKHKFSIN